jgi:hypothetical protein
MRAARLAIRLLLACLATGPGSAAGQREPAAPDSGLERLVHDYIALYREDTLERWEALFLPSFTATFTTQDGTTMSLTLAQFVERQRRGFANTREMYEALENVRTERRGRLASVWADFVFTADGNSRRGRLALLCILDRSEWRIQSLIFSYFDGG